MLKWFKLLVVLLFPILLLAAFDWVSGYIFLYLAGLDPNQTSFFTLYEYWGYYKDDPATVEALGNALFGGFIVMIIPFIAFYYLPDNRKLYGDARWANMSDIQKAGLFSDDGIIVGKYSSFFGLIDKYLVLPDLLHALLGAPTRSGKGVGVVIPNCLSWKDSMIILDIKQENWNITAGYRAKHGQDSYLLNLSPRDFRTHRWNPLFYISEDPAFRINDIQKIAQMLFPTNAHEAPIWQASSRSLWLGIVLYLIETEELPVTLGEILRQLTMGDERLTRLIDERQRGDIPLSSECYLALKEYLDTPSKTRGSVRKGFLSSLELFYNPVLDAATAENDFDLREIRKKRMSIYVGIMPDDLDRFAPLINLFFQQLIDLNTRELPENNPDLKHKCLILADEFTAMGKVGVLSKGISYIAGYGLRLLPIIQSPAQIRSTYGHDEAETFIDNHALRIVFKPENLKVAKEISDSLGTATVSNQSRSKSRASELWSKTTRSENTSESSRALMMPQEVLYNMPVDECIIFYGACPPIKAKKIVWYKDPVFKTRGNGRDGVKWPCPVVPTLDLDAVKKGVVEFEGITSKETITERPVTLDDIENIDQLSVEDFSCDFSEVDIPKGEITDDKMADLAKAFVLGLATN
jgi:type IV secretion system protein VirD4